MMSRREFVALFLVGVVGPRVTAAQRPERMWRVGVLMASSPPNVAPPAWLMPSSSSGRQLGPWQACI